MQTEECPVATVQGCLLLSLSSRHDDRRQGNSVWLSLAIHSAQMHRLNLNQTVGDFPPRLSQRLWWCCVIRDRFMSLMSRRPMQIAPDVFDTSVAGKLTVESFNDITRPTRFQENAKRKLEELFLMQVRLSHALSGLITIAYPATGFLGPQAHSLREYFEMMDRIHASRDDLDAWLGELEAKQSPEADDHGTHEPILLFYSVLMMSYQ